MSVQVKTPTKNQFEPLEIQCGEPNFRNSEKTLVESGSKTRDDLSLRNEGRFSQPWNRKRRYSQSYHKEEGPARRKRLKSSPYFGRQLPTKFLNGGTIEDPLNLNGLDSSELGKQLNSVTPQSSPLPVPKRTSVELRIPVNVTDPLNLSAADEDGTDLEKLFKRKKQRHTRHKKKEESQSANIFSPPKNIAKDKNLLEALKIEIEPEAVDIKDIPSTSKEIVKPRQVSDKIVSPVVRQISPKSKKRRRKSDNKPESSSASRSLLTTTDTETSPVVRSHKKFKHPKTPQKQQKKGQASAKNYPKFVYGNYNRYYGYRNPSATTDQRLLCLNPDWFDGKVILDIGCNVGHVTLAIARDFKPKKIAGIDIDQKLIGAARKNIRYYMSSESAELKKFPISTVLNYGPIAAPPVHLKEKSLFPYNIMFMQGNYVLECDEMLDMQKEEYDVILALSITKWVHFNWGDDGLKRFFKRVFRQLRPGGRFILEPQPWSSYKKKKKLTDEIFKNFQNIKLRPDQFNDFLLSKDVGFSTCNKLEVPIHSSKGFRRPIMVYTKSDTVQNSPYPDIGEDTPVYSNYISSIHGKLTTLTEVSESSCSSSDSSVKHAASPGQSDRTVVALEQGKPGECKEADEAVNKSEDPTKTNQSKAPDMSRKSEDLAAANDNVPPDMVCESKDQIESEPMNIEMESKDVISENENQTVAATNSKIDQSAPPLDLPVVEPTDDEQMETSAHDPREVMESSMIDAQVEEASASDVTVIKTKTDIEPDNSACIKEKCALPETDAKHHEYSSVSKAVERGKVDSQNEKVDSQNEKVDSQHEKVDSQHGKVDSQNAEVKMSIDSREQADKDCENSHTYSKGTTDT